MPLQNLSFLFCLLKDMLRFYRPNILGLSEPKVSGCQADVICKKISFEN